MMLGFLVALQAIGLVVASSSDPSDKCYFIPLPSTPSSTDNRTIPWGEPSIQYANGTTCCSSLDEVRQQLDIIDAQLLQLLSKRCGFNELYRNITEIYAPSGLRTSEKQPASRPQLQMSTIRLGISR
jgi:hypothetical protein